MKPLNLAGNEVYFSYKMSTNEITNKRGEVVEVKKPKHTSVQIVTPYGETLTGTSSCSDKDICSKEVGRKLALKRAISSTTLLSREEKSRFWDAYNKLKPNGRW